MRKVEVVPHSPQWKNLYQTEARAIAKIFDSNFVAVHHIGSTAIPKICAKPIIDLLIVVKDIEKVEQYNSLMENLGYEPMGEFGISDRRYFRKHNSLGIRSHHVHVFPVNSLQIERHLAFRNYLIAHPSEAQQYSNLKRKLARQHPHDIDSYMDGKDEFIQDIDRKAAQYYRSFSDRP